MLVQINTNTNTITDKDTSTNINSNSDKCKICYTNYMEDMCYSCEKCRKEACFTCTNIRICFQFLSMVIPPMQRGGGGQIVCVSSCLALHPAKNLAAYCATKVNPTLAYDQSFEFHSKGSVPLKFSYQLVESF